MSASSIGPARACRSAQTRRRSRSAAEQEDQQRVRELKADKDKLAELLQEEQRLTSSLVKEVSDSHRLVVALQNSRPSAPCIPANAAAAAGGAGREGGLDIDAGKDAGQARPRSRHASPEFTGSVWARTAVSAGRDAEKGEVEGSFCGGGQYRARSQPPRKVHGLSAWSCTRALVPAGGRALEPGDLPLRLRRLRSRARPRASRDATRKLRAARRVEAIPARLASDRVPRVAARLRVRPLLVRLR